MQARRLRHDEVVMHAQRRRFRIVEVFARRVETERNDLGALECEHAKRLGPAPVIADQHAADRVHETPDAKPEVADFEVFFFQVLESRLRLMVRVAGQMDFAVLAHDRTVRRNQDRGIEAARAAFLLGQFRISDIEPDAEFFGFVEERPRLRGRHGQFIEPAVDFALVCVPIAREKRCEREFGKHHEPGTHAVRLSQQVHEPLRGRTSRVGEV